MADTKGHTRAAKHKAADEARQYIRMLLVGSNSETDEVVFNPVYDGQSTVCSDQDTTVQDSVQGSDHSVAARVNNLETNVAQVKSQVNSMDTKLDIILNSALFSNPVATSTPPPGHRPDPAYKYTIM